MKKEVIILFAILLYMLNSCDERSGYRHLDGMWQVQSITRDGVMERPDDMYFSFQMHIIEVRQTGIGSFAGDLDFTDGIMYSKFNGMSEDQAHHFGMKEAEQEFAVEQLSSSKLVLQSDYARVELRKY